MKSLSVVIKLGLILLIILGTTGGYSIAQNQAIHSLHVQSSEACIDSSNSKSKPFLQLIGSPVIYSQNPADEISCSTHKLKNTLAPTIIAVSATFSSGHISTDYGFQTLPGQSSCPATLSVSIPSGAAIVGVDVSYSMTARNQGWMSEQRSQLRCVSPGGISESAISQGSGNTTGTFSYSRNGLTIANGVTGGGNISFQLHAGRTWGGSGCNSTYNRVNNNSWTITVYYSLNPVPNFSANTTNASIGQTVIFTDMSGGPITAWEWDFGSGAMPETANSQGPHEVVYSTLGAKTISLTINGSETETKTDYIIVDEWLHWDDGANFSAVGLTASGTFQIAKRFEPNDISSFISHQITKIRVYIRDLPSSSILKIWQGTNQSNLIEQVSQAFTPLANRWVVVDLNQPYLVDPSTELWFGVEYFDPGSGFFPAGIDELTEHDGKGNLVRLNISDPNNWTPLSTYTIAGEWNLQAYLVPVAVVWTGNVSSEWSVDNNWSVFSVPQSNSDVTIPNRPNHPVINGHVIVNNLTIENNAILTINPQSSLSVNGTLDNQASVTGLVIASTSSGTGSLIHNNNGVEATFQRYVSGEPEAWHLLSSPVTNQMISGSFTPAGTYADGTGYDFYTWFEPDTSWVYFLNTLHSPTWAEVHPLNSFTPAKGYLVAYQQPNPTLDFSGAINAGSISVDLTRTSGAGEEFGTNLLGNPYPSSIDWKSPSGWDRANLELSSGGYDIYVWNDVAYNYGVYNSASTSDEGTLGVTRYIAPTQGFFVRAAQSGNLTMNNEVRVHQGAGSWLKGMGSIKELLHIVVTSQDEFGSDEVLIEFNPYSQQQGSPKKFSFVKNAPSLFIPGNGQFYSFCTFDQVLMQPVIPLAFKAGEKGTYSLRANFDTDYFEMVELIDTQSGQRHNLKEKPVFDFFASDTDQSNRFVIQLQPGLYANPHDAIPARIFAWDNIIYIDMQLVDEDCTMELFDLSGRRIRKETFRGGTTHSFSHTSPGLYIARLTGTTGILSKKIFLQ
jgi:PKD repeat protein